MRIKPQVVWCPVTPEGEILWVYACEKKADAEEDRRTNARFDDKNYWNQTKIVRCQIRHMPKRKTRKAKK